MSQLNSKKAEISSSVHDALTRVQDRKHKEEIFRNRIKEELNVLSKDMKELMLAIENCREHTKSVVAKDYSVAREEVEKKIDELDNTIGLLTVSSSEDDKITALLNGLASTLV